MLAQKRLPSRSPSPSDKEYKKLRLSTPTEAFLNDSSKELVWSDIEHKLHLQGPSTTSEESHNFWISGRVHVVYASKEDANVKRFVLQSKDKRLLTITIANVQYGIVIGSGIRLSLRGALVAKSSNTAANAKHKNLPFSLLFSRGAALSVTTLCSTQECTTVFDAWENPPTQSDDWYSSPPFRSENIEQRQRSIPTTGEPFEVLTSSPSTLPSTPGSDGEALEQDPLVLVYEDDLMAPDPSGSAFGKVDANPVTNIKYPAASLQVPKKPLEEVASCNDPVTSEDEVSSHKQSSAHPTGKRKRRHNRKNGKEKSRQEKRGMGELTEVEPSLPSVPAPSKRNPLLDLKAGITIDESKQTSSNGQVQQTSGVTKYTALSELTRNGLYHNVIAVVSKAVLEPRLVPSGTGDWKIIVELKDPSRFEGNERFQIELFGRPPRHKYLPKAQEGDVLLLRDLKVITKTRSSDGGQYFTGRVYFDKLRWIGYRPSTETIFFTNSDADSEPGELESVMYRPRHVELSYMSELSLWWKALADEKGVVQVSSPIGRKQSLMSDEDVNHFFDAVVEVIKATVTDFNGQKMLEIVVSDYSECPLLNESSTYGQWAVHATSTMIKEEILPYLTEGTFWAFQNVRLKVARAENAGIDLDLLSARLRQVEDIQASPRVQELLERKALFLKDHRPLTEANTFPKQPEIDDIKTVAEAKESENCNLIVELLHRIDRNSSVIDLYVTDYTENDKQSNFKPATLQKKMPNFQMKVLQIGSWDDREFVKNLAIDRFYQIYDVKFKIVEPDGLKGALNAASRRVKMITGKTDMAPAFQAFLKRRDEYRARQNARDTDSFVPQILAAQESSGLVINRLPGFPLFSIKQILADNGSTGTFRTSARVKDFYPPDIRDFCTKVCSNCNHSIQDRYNACMQCEDAEGDYVRWIFRFFLLLEDQEGEVIIIEICREASVFLSGMEPCNLRENDKVFWTVKRRLAGILGNLVDVHEVLERKETIVRQFGPYCDFGIEKAKVDVGDCKEHTVFSLIGLFEGLAVETRMYAALPLSLISLLLAIITDVTASSPTKRDYELFDYFVLEHDTASDVPLHDVLHALSLELVEKAGQLENHWLLRKPKTEEEDPSVSYERFLRKRTFAQPRADDPYTRSLFQAVRHLSLQTPRQRVKRDDFELRAPQSVDWLNLSSSDIAEREGIVDPLFKDQWHLVNDEYPEHMVNAAPVWDMGIAGEGVISAMVDDGLDFESDDLAANFDAVNSYDFNLHVDLPKPVLFDDHHGTRCAGQIAAVKNDVCGVGIAYASKVAGVRILSGPISDIDEAAALNYGFQNTSIYSCSWGPPDDGRSMEGPSYLIQKAVVNGIQNGRGGKGSIFVFASGNGAAHEDQCNFDGYTNSIYSVTVAAIDYKGLHPYYSESCAANMVVTYSSGSGNHIVTTDVGKNECSRNHGGTSAAAPNAVGIFALALSTRPDLTWRDIQHLCVRTARMINPDDPDWEDTAAGRRFSYKYGYGSLDAYDYVRAAQEWDLVKPQAWLHSPVIQLNSGTMTIEGLMDGGETITQSGVMSKTSITSEMLDDANFEKLEHVNVRVWIKHTRRGDVEIELRSPNGVKSMLAGRRKSDDDKNGYPGWTFMSVKHWDEDPIGEWSIRVWDQGAADQSGSFIGWSLTLWGSTIDASEAKTYLLLDPDTAFPPPTDQDDSVPPSTPSATVSKIRPKPTEGLPDDHGTAEGEADKPAFSSARPSETSIDGIEETMTPTPDEGWFPGMSHLVSNSKWVFGAIAVVVVCGIGGGAFFLWRRRQARRAQYRSLTGDDVTMQALDRNGRAMGTKELYDAFGEVSEEDEDADEETGLRRPLTRDADLRFHDHFLEDDDRTPRSPQQEYRDDPLEEEGKAAAGPSGQDRSKSPSSSGESWEHADPS